MIVHALGLEEDRRRRVAPKVRHRIAAVTSTGLYFQHTPNAQPVRASLALLLPPGLVADGRTQGDLLPIWQNTPHRTDQHSEAALLQDRHVVVVGVSHGPAGRVPFGLIIERPIHVPAVAVGPLVEVVQVAVGDVRHVRVVDVPLEPDPAGAVGCDDVRLAGEGRKSEF